MIGEDQYINLLKNVLEHGEESQGRNAITKVCLHNT